MYSAVICSRRSFFSISCFGTDGTHTDLSLVCLLRSLALGSVVWLVAKGSGGRLYPFRLRRVCQCLLLCVLTVCDCVRVNMASVDDVDVQMKEVSLEKESGEGDQKGEVAKVQTPLEKLGENIAMLIKGAERKDPRIVRRVLRRTTEVRRTLSLDDLKRALGAFLSTKNVENKPALVETVERMGASDASGEDVDMVAGTAPALPPTTLTPTTGKTMPEVEVYLHLLVVAAALKRGAACQQDACACSALLVDRLLSFEPRHTLGSLGARAYQYFSTAYESVQQLSSIRGTLLLAHRTACLRHDAMGQATLVNLLLRNYLHYNLYDQALLLFENSSDFPASASNNQFVRHLYYRGLIQAIQLEYTEAHQKLTQALRKAPRNSSSAGFRLTVQRLAIVVQLLMAEVPDRSAFNQEGLRAALDPYLQLTQTVRSGDIGMFQQVLSTHRETFAQDRTLNLILRLRHSVIKTGLRNISLSYSKISFEDVAKKLNMDSALDAEYVCAKAVIDGVIDATLHHDEGFLRSRETTDAYNSTTQPQQAYHARIEFCLEVRNDAVKAMQYPPGDYKDKLKKVNEIAAENAKEMDEIENDPDALDDTDDDDM